MPHPAVLAGEVSPGEWGLTGYAGWIDDTAALRSLPSTLSALGCTVERHEPEHWTVHGADGSTLGEVHATLTYGDGEHTGEHDEGGELVRWEYGVGYIATVAGSRAPSQPFRHPGQAVLAVLARATCTRTARQEAARGRVDEGCPDCRETGAPAVGIACPYTVR